MGRLTILLLTVSYAAGFSLLNCLKYRNFDWSTIDVANNILWFERLLSPWWREYGYFEFIGRYVVGILIQPVSLLLILAHKVFSTPYLLSILPALAVAMGIPILYRLAMLRLNHQPVAIALALAYALNPFINMLTLLGFRYDALALPLVLMVHLAVATGNRRMFWLALILSNACKINVVLINGIFCFLAFRSRKAPYLKRAWLLCVVWFIVAGALMGIIRFFIPGGILQGVPPEQIKQVLLVPALQDPAFLFYTLEDHSRSGDYMWLVHYLAPVLFLPLAAIRTLLPVLPEAAYVFLYALALGKIPGMAEYHRVLTEHGYLFIYPAAYLVAFLHIGSVYGAGRIAGWAGGGRRRLLTFLAGLWISVVVVFHYVQTPPVFGPVPLSRYFNVKYYRMTEHTRHLRDAFRQLPEDRKPYLLSGVFCERAEGRFERYYLSGWDGTPSDRFNVVLVDLFSFEFAMTRDEMIEKILLLLSDGSFGVTLFHDGIIRMERGASVGPNTDVRAFIHENFLLLKENLLPPYTLGADAPFAAAESPRYYSTTQLVPEDRVRLESHSR